MLLCIITCDAIAQSASLQMGARAHGLAYASSCLTDAWSLTNNIAGLAKSDQVACGFSYNAIPSFPFFNRTAAVFAVPFETGGAGLSIFRFGDDLYSEQVLSMGMANRFGLASLGLKANWLQYRADGKQTYNAFTLSFGGIAEITPTVSFGAHIINVNQPLINGLSGERIPTRLIAGAAFTPSSKLLIVSEIEKDLDYSPIWKTGLEYEFFKKIAFRTGFNVNPEAYFFGIGAKSKKFQLDYALQLHDALGLSHQAAVAYQFKRP